MSYSAYIARQSAIPNLSLQYSCSCGELHPVYSLYCCSDCNYRLLCELCTNISIDTYYCPSCLNSVFSSQALNNENKCEQCVECSVCSNNLVIQSKALTNPQTNTTQTIYYYHCEYCKISSDDLFPPLTANEPNLLVAKIKDREANNQLRTDLQRLSLQFKQKYKSFAAGSQLLSQLNMATASVTNLTSSALSSAAPQQGILQFIKDQEERQAQQLQKHYKLPKEPIELEFPAVPRYFYGEFATGPNVDKSQPRHLYEISNLSQRLASPSVQSAVLAQFYPRRKQLLTKLAHRCKKCSKYVVKPGPGAGKISFEIHQAALSTLPTLTIAPFTSPLAVKTPQQIIIYLKNPLEKEIRLRLLHPAVKNAQEKLEIKENPKETDQKIEKFNNRPVVAGKAKRRVRVPRSENVYHDETELLSANCTAEFSSEWVILPGYDDLNEENLNSPTNTSTPEQSLRPEDNRKLVFSRYLSKVGLILQVTPHNHSDSCWFELILHFEAVQKGLSGPEELQAKIRISLGMAGDANAVRNIDPDLELLNTLGRATSPSLSSYKL
jgi:dynactin-4